MTTISPESLNAHPWISTFAAAITGGGFVGWYRERRKGKRDASDFALSFIREQSSRIDSLVAEMADVKADQKIANADKARLEQEVDRLKTERAADKAEIQRLRTALITEADKAAALALPRPSA